jgi:hypothetical protein
VIQFRVIQFKPSWKTHSFERNEIDSSLGSLIEPFGTSEFGCEGEHA